MTIFGFASYTRLIGQTVDKNRHSTIGNGIFVLDGRQMCKAYRERCIIDARKCVSCKSFKVKRDSTNLKTSDFHHNWTGSDGLSERMRYKGF